MREEFSRTAFLLGEEAMERLAKARVAVFGLGGVGGYVVEALARGGIGALDLVDNDTVSRSNINRQILATYATVGMPKVEAAKQRLLQINSELEIRTYQTFYTPATADEFDFSQYDYIVDAIDTVTGKLELISRAFAVNTPVISCMGTGNKLDASAFEVEDISKTTMCPLARVMRKELKKRGISHLKVVWSDEAPRLPIEAENSRKAVGALADKINMELLETARGIISVSNSNIVKEIKNVTVAKGYNPSEFCLVAFGGSGPLHAAELMEEMSIQKALIPKTPGLLAAYGLLTENMRRDFVQTYVMDISDDCAAILENWFAALEKDAEQWFDEEKIEQSLRSREYFLDMRYKGQNHEIRVPITTKDIASAQTLRDAFTAAYERLYSFSSKDTVQIVNFGLSALGDIVYPVIVKDEYAGEDPSAAVIGSRHVYEGNGQYADYILYDREKLHCGNVIQGPAIIEQMDSTTIVLSNQKATVDEYLNMMIERK